MQRVFVGIGWRMGVTSIYQLIALSRLRVRQLPQSRARRACSWSGRPWPPEGVNSVGTEVFQTVCVDPLGSQSRDLGWAESWYAGWRNRFRNKYGRVVMNESRNGHVSFGIQQGDTETSATRSITTGGLGQDLFDQATLRRYLMNATRFS